MFSVTQTIKHQARNILRHIHVTSKWEPGRCAEQFCFVCPSVPSLSLGPTRLCAAALWQGWDDHRLESPEAQRRNEDPGLFPGPARPLWAGLARSQHSANSSASLHGIHLEHSWEQLDQGLSWLFSTSSSPELPCCPPQPTQGCTNHVCPSAPQGQQPAGGAPVRVPCPCHEQGWSWGSVRAQWLVQMWGMDNARARYPSFKTIQENTTRCICYLLTLPRDFYHTCGCSQDNHTNTSRDVPMQGIIPVLHRNTTQVFLIILFPENEESGSKC